MKKNKFFSQILVFGLKDCTFIRRGSEEPLNEFPIYETVINSQDMKLWLRCSHPHLWKGENGLKIFEETKNELEKRLVGRKVYVLCFVLWWKKRERDGIFGRGRGRALYWNKTHQNPHPTKQDPTRFHPKSCKFSKLILNYRASNEKL